MDKQSLERLKSELVSRPVKVTFTKVNGDLRVMNCTLNEALLPKVEHSTTKYSEGVTRVFDLDKQEWRAFKNDNVVEFV